MEYNVKTLQYLDSFHMRIYEKTINLDNKIPKKQRKPKQKTPDSICTQEMIDHSETSSKNRTVNMIYNIARSNKWEYMITLTIDPKKLDRTDYDLITNKLIIWLNNLKKRYAPDLVYLLVPELHSDGQSFHFHGFFSTVGNIPFEFSGKVCVGKYVYDYVRKPYAQKIYNLPLWKYGWSHATIIRDSARASSYITKYVTKELTVILKNKHRYFASHNINKPHEQYFNIHWNTLEEIMLKHMPDVDYVKTVKVKAAHQEIHYLEFNHDNSKIFKQSL